MKSSIFFAAHKKKVNIILLNCGKITFNIIDIYNTPTHTHTHTTWFTKYGKDYAISAETKIVT